MDASLCGSSVSKNKKIQLIHVKNSLFHLLGRKRWICRKRSEKIMFWTSTEAPQDNVIAHLVGEFDDVRRGPSGRNKPTGILVLEWLPGRGR